ncbi:hypothetical protein Nham_3305 [Nitrobacter hamburgensis X14]|uniref:Uncharacterized protein n=1 Tax=Nitrobacter hamburgensis (strain DSM 10229 / NCIMB 13809 / X14) TaxID=323097 RepID=Q1QIA9_NITHX|nr:hypothetical protein [Nitrobacter hamburgensis]ABE64038.1 hypothetical protein Nham_3305 [Nitrobacter hamburgensis X14]
MAILNQARASITNRAIQRAKYATLAETQFTHRRTKSKYADDKAVDGFERVVEQTGIIESDPIDELAGLMKKDDPTPEDLERIGKLLTGE